MELSELVVYIAVVLLLTALAVAVDRTEKIATARGWHVVAAVLGAVRALLPADVMAAGRRFSRSVANGKDGPPSPPRPPLLPALFLLALTSCTPDQLTVAIKASNVALEVGNDGAEVLRKVCQRPMEALEIARAGAPDEKARAEVVKKAVDLASRCDPAAGVHESFRAAHRALRVGIAAALAGKVVDMLPLALKVATATAELERALAALTGGK